MVKMAADGCLNSIPFLLMTPPTVFKMKSFCLADQLHDTRDVHDKSCKILLFVELGLFIGGGGHKLHIYGTPMVKINMFTVLKILDIFGGFFCRYYVVFFNLDKKYKLLNNAILNRIFRMKNPGN